MMCRPLCFSNDFFRHGQNEEACKEVMMQTVVKYQTLNCIGSDSSSRGVIDILDPICSLCNEKIAASDLALYLQSHRLHMTCTVATINKLWDFRNDLALEISNPQRTAINKYRITEFVVPSKNRSKFEMAKSCPFSHPAIHSKSPGRLGKK